MRALVIATSPGERGVEPDHRLAGLGLLLRAVLTLQSRGVEGVDVVGPPALVAEIEAERRVEIEVALHEGELDARTLVTRYDHVVSPAVYDQLLATPEGRVAVTGDHGTGPAVLIAGDEPRLPPTGATDVTWLEPVDFVHDVSTAEGRRAAIRSLFEACRKPVDGFVSRHLNRRLSLFVSRRLVDTPVTPNAMTAVTFGVALVASWLAFGGGYLRLAAGGVLMQINSILDGCDGELARVRFEGSKLGQWLDTIGDDLSNVIFWASVAHGASTIPVWGGWLARAGYLTAGANGLAALANYAVLSRKGSGDFYALQEGEHTTGQGLRGKVMAFFNTVLRQDFFLFLVMILALAGLLPWALPLLALGAVITMIASLLRAGRFFARYQRNSK